MSTEPQERRSAVAHEAPRGPSGSAVDLRAKGSRLWMVMIVGGVVLAGGALALFAFKGKDAGKENARKAGAAAGDGIEPADGTMGMGQAQDIIMQGMRDDVAKKPCDKALNYKLAVALIEEGAYEDAGDVSDKYAAACPEVFVRLLRKGYYAHEKAERWANAADTAGRLIAAEPAEGSFWWWRGQARVKLNQLVPAAADLRQAMAGTPFAQSQGYSLRDFAKIAEQVGATCDAAAALQAYADAKGGDVAISFVDLQSRLHLAGGCEKVYGTGSFGNPANPAIDTIEVKVGKTKGKFVLGLRTGYTVLSRAFAAKAGVTTAGDPHQTYAASTLLSGQPGVAPMVTYGGGSAPDIQVLVVDALPGELDGVLGRSFLYRFQYQEPTPADDGDDYDDE